MFNSLLEEECISKSSYSDDELARRLGIVARRTVAKYRELANIPNHVDRQKAYKEEREQPFSTSTTMTFLVPDFDQITPDYPHGYGRCQCGCNQVTQMRRTGSSPEWVWKSYLDGHEPNPARSAEGCPIENTMNDANVHTLKGVSVEDPSALALTNEPIATGTRMNNLPGRRTREPSFGQKTRNYPLGYGYCQCGCGLRTERHASGIHSMFLQGHVGTINKHSVEDDSRLSELQHKYDYY